MRIGLRLGSSALAVLLCGAGAAPATTATPAKCRLAGDRRAEQVFVKRDLHVYRRVEGGSAVYYACRGNGGARRLGRESLHVDPSTTLPDGVVFDAFASAGGYLGWQLSKRQLVVGYRRINLATGRLLAVRPRIPARARCRDNTPELLAWALGAHGQLAYIQASLPGYAPGPCLPPTALYVKTTERTITVDPNVSRDKDSLRGLRFRGDVLSWWSQLDPSGEVTPRSARIP
jgi:hypothetical protein